MKPTTSKILITSLCALCASVWPVGAFGASQVSVGKHKVLELVFTAAEHIPTPFDTYLLKLEVKDPTGKTFVVDGFYDGDGNGRQDGKIWKARLCPYMTGVWSWRTTVGDAPDRGLAGLQGQFTCVESDDRGGVVSQGRYFKLQDGGYIFPVGNFLDSVSRLPRWSYIGEEVTDVQRQQILRRQRDIYTANKYFFYVSNHSDTPLANPNDEAEAYSEYVTPWVGTQRSNDKTKMDLQRWMLYDTAIRELKDNRMLAEAVIFEDGKRASYGFLPVADKNRLFRYLMARTSAFNHMMYIVCLEWPEAWKKEQVNAAGVFVQAHNPWNRPVSVHLWGGKAWVFSGEKWPTFIASQPGSSSLDNVNQYILSLRGEILPHLAEEFGSLKTESDARLRGSMWVAFCSGAAGVGTGSDQKAFQRFLAQSRVPFQRMSPGNHFVEHGGATCFCLAEDGHHYVVYSPSGSIKLDVIQGKRGVLTGRWFNPRDPNALLGRAFSITTGPQVLTPPADTTKDWVLSVSDGSNLGDGNNYPSPNAAVTRVTVAR